MEEVPSFGRITVAPHVLETIARLTALAVPGVVCISPPSGVLRFLGTEKGVRVLVHDGTVDIDLHIVVESNRNALGVGRQVQTEVTRAMEEMVGLKVQVVNVYIEDFELQE